MSRKLENFDGYLTWEVSQLIPANSDSYVILKDLFKEEEGEKEYSWFLEKVVAWGICTPVVRKSTTNEIVLPSKLPPEMYHYTSGVLPLVQELGGLEVVGCDNDQLVGTIVSGHWCTSSNYGYDERLKGEPDKETLELIRSENSIETSLARLARE